MDAMRWATGVIRRGPSDHWAIVVELKLREAQ
jgi:hypothetical protein